VVVREFAVVDGREEDFAEVFRPGGIWQGLLRSSPGYLASELLKLSSGPGQYEVFDYWRSHEDFESCRQERQQEIERFKLLFLESLILHETFLGGFYEDGPDESGLVLR
jgi:heme-degrading monooxygenase HmoA